MVVLCVCCLESEEQQEGHHQTEQTHGFRQGESQDSVGEQLLLQRWVSCVADDQGTEYCSDTGTWNGGKAREKGSRKNGKRLVYIV